MYFNNYNMSKLIGIDIYGVLLDITGGIIQYTGSDNIDTSCGTIDFDLFKRELSDYDFINGLELNEEVLELKDYISFLYLDTDYNIKLIEKLLNNLDIKNIPIITNEGGLVSKNAVISDSDIIFGTNKIDYFITSDKNFIENNCFNEKIDVYLYSKYINESVKIRKRIFSINNFINKKILKNG